MTSHRPDLSDPALRSAMTRDHLANERTYLAWVRTAAAVTVLGLAVAEFVRGGRVLPIVAGILLVGVGAVGIAYAAVRYRRCAADIDDGRLQVARSTRGPMVAGTVLELSLVAALVLLLL